MKDYHINVFHSEEDDIYGADIPDLRFCRTMSCPGPPFANPLTPLPGSRQMLTIKKGKAVATVFAEDADGYCSEPED